MFSTIVSYNESNISEYLLMGKMQKDITYVTLNQFQGEGSLLKDSKVN